MSSKPPVKASTQPTAEYGEGSIRVLKGLEPVKRRPGMYTRTDNPLHIIQEVIDNAADEALAGFGKRIARDAAHRWFGQRGGRRPGHSLWPAPGRGRERGRDRVHAPARGGQVRQGLGRGVQLLGSACTAWGVSVTNALSTRLQVTVSRDKQVATLAFSGGDVIEPVTVRPAASGDRKNGTTVRRLARCEVFRERQLPKGELVHMLRSKAVLMPGVTDHPDP